MNISMKNSLTGLTGAAILAAALGLNLAGPHRAYAAPHNAAVPGASDLGVTILSPDPHVTLAGLKPVEISAFYQGSPANQIVAIELFIDGAKAATKTLDVPETRGVVSFLINAAQISAGLHKVVIRATAADQEVQSARTSFLFGDTSAPADLSAGGPVLPLPSSGPAQTTSLPPVLRLINPATDGKVQGVVTLKVEATDPSGKAPYVSLFIDKTFKTLRNFAPYEFEWDTTTYPNGYHTIEAYGYNDSPSIGHARSMRVYVNNPGGDTGIRRDLLDGPKTIKAARSAPGTPPSVRKHLGQWQRLGQSQHPAQMPQREMSERKVALLTPAHPKSTQEIVRQLASGAGAIRFGALNFATELSSPFAADTAPEVAAKPVSRPARGYKPLAAKALLSAKALPAGKTVTDPMTAETPTKTRVSERAARLQRMASVRLPSSALVSPFAAVPHVAAGAQTPTEIKVGVAARAQRITQTVIKPVLKMHPLRVHLPASLGSLLRSVGQKSLLFNNTTVTLDRPLAAQNNVLFGPLRQIFEQGGGTLTWESRTGTVRAKSATKDILLTVGNNQAVVNAKEVTLDGKPYLLMGRTMVPLSFITAAMDADVQFDAATGHLLITSRK